MEWFVCKIIAFFRPCQDKIPCVIFSFWFISIFQVPFVYILYCIFFPSSLFHSTSWLHTPNLLLRLKYQMLKGDFTWLDITWYHLTWFVMAYLSNSGRFWWFPFFVPFLVNFFCIPQTPASEYSPETKTRIKCRREDTNVLVRFACNVGGTEWSTRTN